MVTDKNNMSQINCSDDMEGKKYICGEYLGKSYIYKIISKK